MKYSSQLVLIICLLFCTITSFQVLNLTTQSFASTISSNKYVMVKFYASWCGHCKTMIPEYEKLAELIRDNDVAIGQIDATVETKIAEKYEVNGFPTIKFFVDGLAVDYKGPRTAEEMYQWIKKVTETEIKSITEQEIDSLKEIKPLVVYYGTNQTILTMLKLLTTIDNSTSYFFSSQKPQQSSLLLFSEDLHNPIEFNQSQPLTLQSIKQWVLIKTIDVVVPLTTKEHLEYVFYDKKSQKDVAMLVKENDINDEDYANFRKICTNNKAVLKCCLVDKDMEIYTGVKSYVRSRGKTILTLTRDTLKQAYTYPHPLSALTQQSWSSFIKQVASSKHKNIAAGENDQIEYQHAKILTTENYTSFINYNEVVLVEYVSPGCAKCAEFADEYDQIAREVYEKQKAEFEVTAIDMRKNMEVAAQLQIMDFPTFRLHLSGAHIEYKGARDKKQLLKFIQTTMNIKPIQANSINEIPTSSVTIYDPAPTSTLRHLPAIFTRYPIYHLKQGSQIKVVVRHNDQEKTFPSDELALNVSSVSRWLYKETDPVLVDLLMTNVDGKLKDALKNQINLLGFIDVQPEFSTSLRQTIQKYCKQHTEIVCGYAKKGQDHFEELMAWAGIDKDITTSELIYVNTTSFEKFIFTQNIEQLNLQMIEQFVLDVKEGKAKKNQHPVITENIQTSQEANNTSTSDEL